MKKVGVFILALVLMLSGSGLAANETFSVQESYDWLNAQAGSEGSYGNVEKTALAVMALDSVDYDTSLSQEWLDSQMSENFCYPSSSCSAYDTAFAVIALNELQDDLNFADIEEWYKDSLKGGDFSGEWYLEAVTSSSGDCVVSYDLEGNLKEITVPVEAGVFTSCGNSNFLNLDECLQAGLISANPGISLDVDCSGLSGVTLTEIYKSASTYYILANENSNMADIVVNNGCFGKSPGASCDPETTMYSALALKDMDSSINNFVYLKENYDVTDSKKAALMYLITGDAKYLDDLVGLQKSDGSFNRDYYSTGLAAWALKGSQYGVNYENAKMYLKDNQGSNGDWGGSVEATAMVLYGAFSDEDVTPSEFVSEECSADSDCGEGYTCEKGSCKKEVVGGACATNDDCTEKDYVCLDNVCTHSQCNNKGNCEYPKWYENVYNCPSDCKCGDSICDDIEEKASEGDKYYCAEDCLGTTNKGSEEECSNDSDCGEDEKCSFGNCITNAAKSSSSNGWIWAVIIIILLVGGLSAGGYYAYKKGYLDQILKKGGGSKVQPQQTAYTPYTSRLPPQQPRRPF
jgi:hypothetical protein